VEVPNCQKQSVSDAFQYVVLPPYSRSNFFGKSERRELASAKVQSFYEKRRIKVEKVYYVGVFSKEMAWKQVNIRHRQMEERCFSFTSFGSRRSKCLVIAVKCRVKGPEGLS